MNWAPSPLQIEHMRCFTQYLSEKGYIQNDQIVKKDMRKIHEEYCTLLNIRPVSHVPWRLLPVMHRFKIIKAKKESDNDIIFFKAHNLQKNVYGKNPGFTPQKQKKPSSKSQTPVSQSDVLPTQTPPSNDAKKQRRNNRKKSSSTSSSPKKLTLVDQRVALPSPTKGRASDINISKCDLCNIRFKDLDDYMSHVQEESHKLRKIYRSDKKQLMSKNKDIVIEYETEGNEQIEFTSKPNSQNIIRLHLKNKSTSNIYELKNIILLYTKTIGFTMKHQLPIILNKNSIESISIGYCFNDVGAYVQPMVFQVYNSATNKTYNFLKEMFVYVQSDSVGDLKATGPYKRRDRAVISIETLPIIDGIKPASNSTKGLVFEKKLEQNKLPDHVRKILNSGLKPNKNMTKPDLEQLNHIKRLLDVPDRNNCLNVENYCTMLKLLLYIEEHQMQKDIHDYDCSAQRLEKVPGQYQLLSLTVPGLSENRPSLIRGDDLTVRIPGDNIRYRGYVHAVRETSVWLGFYQKFFNDLHFDTNSYDVMFGFNRFTIKTEHQAIDLVNEYRLASHFFPVKLPSARKVLDTEIQWFERNILNNKEQQQAVRQIYSCSSFPYPYLLFGPPGTGKTMTMVESILQIWKNKPKCNILVAAPSNSAADEVTIRLVKVIKNKIDLFRMYSASFPPNKIHPELKQFSNIMGDEFFYPELKELLKYRIVIVTLTAAAKLVNGKVPPNHFAYVFIDESGHATETEVLIPISGILSSKNNAGTLLGQVILAGDPQQLGPIIHSKLAEIYGFGTSMLERLMTHFDVYKKDANTDKYNPTMVTKLLQNFRSHPAILELPDRMFYDCELIPKGNELVDIAIDWEHLPNKKFPIIYHSVKGKDCREDNSPSYFNIQEIDIIIQYLGYLIGNRLNGRKIAQSDIGIVSPYRKQVQKINQACRKKNWHEITIGSVEQFQGQEKLIIIISTVRSRQELVDQDYKFHLGFLRNPKRFNVAITRAKALLIAIGNPDVLQYDSHWRQLIEYCCENKAIAGTEFKLKDKQENNNDSDELIEDFVKLSLTSNDKNASNEHADFSRGNL